MIMSNEELLSRAQGRNMRKYCEEHNVKYTHQTAYINTMRAAVKRELRTSNGMLYHVPRGVELSNLDSKSSIQTILGRVYLLWFNEPSDTVIESLAFLRMATQREIMLVRCNKKLLQEKPSEARIYSKKTAPVAG